MSPLPLKVERAVSDVALSEFVDRDTGAERVLLTMDAPLGWPVSMTRGLSDHIAGRRIDFSGNDLFNRATDREIRRRFKKKPLEVGADRIARTALAALEMIESLRVSQSQPIPLSWDHRIRRGIEAIEVYPAVTLLARDIPPKGYKKPAEREGRLAIVTRLESEGHVVFGASLEACLESADVLDAVIALLAGYDYLAGEAVAPADLRLAKQEGWIWARRWEKSA